MLAVDGCVHRAEVEDGDALWGFELGWRTACSRTASGVGGVQGAETVTDGSL
jgi:hypothetical protein